VRLLQRLVDPSVVFFLPDRHHADLNVLFRKGVVGGLSIIWRRLSVKGVTRIRDGPHLVRKTLGYDANRLGQMDASTLDCSIINVGFLHSFCRCNCNITACTCHR